MITSLGAAFSPNIMILLIFRFLMGIAIGMDSPVAFTFIAEISNKVQRGRNVNYWQVVWYIAIVTSSLVVIAFFLMGAGETLWRMAVGFGTCIALVLYIMRLKYLQESPTWIIDHFSLEKATHYIQKHYDVQLKLDERQGEHQSNAQQQSYKVLLKTIFKEIDTSNSDINITRYAVLCRIIYSNYC